MVEGFGSVRRGHRREQWNFSTDWTEAVACSNEVEALTAKVAWSLESGRRESPDLCCRCFRCVLVDWLDLQGEGDNSRGDNAEEDVHRDSNWDRSKDDRRSIPVGADTVGEGNTDCTAVVAMVGSPSKILHLDHHPC